MIPCVSLCLNEISLASLYINPHVTQGTLRKENVENKSGFCSFFLDVEQVCH